jgi:hypothetical protein
MENFPNSYEGFVNESTEAFCKMLKNPELWSQTMAQRTLRRIGSSAYNIQDVQHIIREYLSLLSESVQAGVHK